jgi:hypothetical protein
VDSKSPNPSGQPYGDFVPFWQDATRRLVAGAKLLSSLVEHHPTIGSWRELLFRENLKQFVPNEFTVATGFIVSENKKCSRQQDVIIYNSNKYAAIFKEGDLVVVPSKAVVSSIEVKSTLTVEGLKSAIENGLSVRSIAPHSFNSIFAFESAISLKTAAEKCGDFYIELLSGPYDEARKKFVPALTSIAVLDRGVIHGLSTKPQSKRLAYTGEVDFLVPIKECSNETVLGTVMAVLAAEISGYQANPDDPKLNTPGAADYLYPHIHVTNYETLCYNYYFNAWGWCHDDPYNPTDDTQLTNSPFQGPTLKELPIPKDTTHKKFISRFDRRTRAKLAKIYKVKS